MTAVGLKTHPKAIGYRSDRVLCRRIHFRTGGEEGFIMRHKLFHINYIVSAI